MELAVFLATAAVALTAAILVVALRNPVRGAVALLGCMLCAAALFVLLRAPSLAALQVVVALGIALALFILSRTVAAADNGPRTWGRARTCLVLVPSALLLLQVGRRLLPGGEPASAARGLAAVPGSIGRLLFTDFLLPLGIVMGLLVVVMVAVVALARSWAPRPASVGADPVEPVTES